MGKRKTISEKQEQLKLDRYGYVVYTRRSKNDFWEMGRVRQENKIRDWYSAISPKPSIGDYVAAGQFLINLGQREEKKEKKLIESIGLKIDNPEDEIEFIKRFNEVLVGKEQYKDALHRLDIAINNKDKKGKDGRGLAPTITALFASQLKDVFNEKLQELFDRKQKTIVRSKNIDATMKNIEKEVVKIFYESLDVALERLLKYQNTKGIDDRFGSLKGYEEIFNIIDKNEYLKQAFQQSMRSRFDPEKIKNAIRKNRQKIIEKKGKINVKKDLGSDILKLRSRAGSLGGDVNEIFNAARDMKVDIGENGTKVAGSFISNKMLTDEMVVFEMEGTIDMGTIYSYLEDLNNGMEGREGEDLVEAHKIMKNFWDEKLSKLNNGFIVFKNAKSYGLKNIENETFGGGFKGGKSVSLNRLQQMPKPEGAFSNIDLDKFVMVIANTIPGAILENKYTDISRWLYLYITESIANLLFDDWEKIGAESTKEEPNAIHALLLEDINVPLSIFLKGAGQALIDSASDFYESEYVKMDIHRSEPLYNEDADGRPEGYPMVTTTSGRVVPAVGMAWNIQKARALADYHIGFRFYKNFNDEIVRKIIAAI